MYTKSLIQQHLERINLLETFKQDVNELMDKYIIENSVFGMNYNGRAKEMVAGYFVIDESYDSLNDCMKGLKNNQYIQIVNNNEFITGNIEYNLFNCPQDKKVLDLETLNYVR
jgi:hypothetical protein